MTTGPPRARAYPAQRATDGPPATPDVPPTLDPSSMPSPPAAPQGPPTPAMPARYPEFRGLRSKPAASGRLPAIDPRPAVRLGRLHFRAIWPGPLGRHRGGNDRFFDRGVFRRSRRIRSRSSCGLDEFDECCDDECGAGSSAIDQAPSDPIPADQMPDVGVGDGVLGASWSGLHRHRESR